MSEVKPGIRTGEALERLARHCLAQIAHHESGAVGRDAQALHKMRVGVRQLRSLFTTFKRATIDDEIRDLRGELQWIQAVLGGCRDWDVFIAGNISPLCDRLADDGRVRRFAALPAAAREHAYDELERVAQTARYRALHERMEALLADVDGFGTDWMRRPVERFARRALKKRMKKVRALAGDGDLATTALPDLHELRKEIKKERYAVAFFAPLYRRKRVKHRLRRLTSMQRLIGEMVDFGAGQALIDALDPGRRADKQAVEDDRALVTGWMLANSTECRDRLGTAWDRYRSLKPLR